MARLDVPVPGAIYTVGLNYRAPGERDGSRPERPLIYGKAATSVAGDGATLHWDRTLTANVDAEVELGVVIGETAWNVPPEEAHPARPGVHDRERRLVARPVARRRPVAARKVDAGVLPGRPKDRPGRGPRSGGPPPRLHHQRRGDPGRADIGHALRGRRDRRLPEPPRGAQTRRPDRQRARRSGSPRRPDPTGTSSPATSSTCWIEGIGELTTHIA